MSIIASLYIASLLVKIALKRLTPFPLFLGMLSGAGTAVGPLGDLLRSGTNVPNLLRIEFRLLQNVRGVSNSMIIYPLTSILSVPCNYILTNIP
jgi:hypothetical protein